MKRVYVAGKYNGPNVIEVLANMRRGIEWGARIMEMGMAPYVPWLDFQLGLTEEFTVEQFKECSMAWVGVCDAMFLVPEWEQSKGVADELVEARKFNVPVFYDIQALSQWNRSNY